MVQNCQKNWMTSSEPIVKKKPWTSYCSGKKEEKNTTRITPDSNRTVRHRNFLQPLLPDFLLRKDQDPDGQWTGVYKDFKHIITTETFIFTFILLHGVISFTFIFPHFLAWFFFYFWFFLWDFTYANNEFLALYIQCVFLLHVTTSLIYQRDRQVKWLHKFFRSQAQKWRIIISTEWNPLSPMFCFLTPITTLCYLHLLSKITKAKPPFDIISVGTLVSTI